MKYNKGENSNSHDTEIKFSRSFFIILKIQGRERLSLKCSFRWDSNPEDQFSKVYGGIWTPHLRIWRFSQQLSVKLTVSSTIHLHDLWELFVMFIDIFQVLFVQVGWDATFNTFDQMWHDKVSGEFILIKINWSLFNHFWKYSKIRNHNEQHETHPVWTKKQMHFKNGLQHWQYLRPN